MKCALHSLNLAVSSVCEVGLPGKQGKKKSENRIWRRWCIISTPQAIHSLPTENGDSVDWEMEMSQSYSQKKRKNWLMIPMVSLNSIRSTKSKGYETNKEFCRSLKSIHTS